MTTPPQPGIRSSPLDTDAPWLEDAPAGAAEQGKRVSVFDLLMVLARQRRLILWTTAIFAFLALAYSFLAPHDYESQVTILPPAQMASRGIGGSIQDLSAALSTAEGFAFKSAEDFWTSVLKGRTISDRVIKEQNLMQVYRTKRMSDAETALKKHTTFDIDKAGLITITVRDHDPNRAAAIANAYISSMHTSMSDMAIEDAEQRQLFFNAQVEEEHQKMKDAEAAMLAVEKRTGVIALGGQTEEAIRQIADLRARITERNVELQSLRAAATDENPEVQRLKTEIGANESELKKAESAQGRSAIGDITASDVPQDTLDYISASRDVRYHETLYEALGRQVEAARMDEARSAPSIQIVDAATPPDHTSGLGRGTLLLLGLILGFITGVILGVARQVYWNLKATQEGQRRLAELAATVRGRA